MADNYSRTSPCNNCPYRKDAPLQMWDKHEFDKLLANEKTTDPLGCPVYGCHKADGHVCIGWLMNQDKRYFPSILLRMSLSSNKVGREYLDKLHSKSEMYGSVEEMCEANYPSEFPILRKVYANRIENGKVIPEKHNDYEN